MGLMPATKEQVILFSVATLLLPTGYYLYK
jgi:hypothetical protein